MTWQDLEKFACDLRYTGHEAVVAWDDDRECYVLKFCEVDYFFDEDGEYCGWGSAREDILKANTDDPEAGYVEGDV